MEVLMTELEKIQHAKNYIDQMANGINPVTKAYAQENDTLNNVHVSRCLFYVSDILRQVIDNGGVIQARKEALQPFFITDEQKCALKSEGRPVYVRDMTDNINKVTAENNTKKFIATWITEWLVSIGAFEVIEGKKHATEFGVSLGITTEQRYSSKCGNYIANVYSPQAQDFVYDNIDAVIEYKNSKNNGK